MKMNIEVEIDWIEDGSLTDEFRDEVLQSVIHDTKKVIGDSIVRESREKLTGLTDDLITESVNETIKNFLEKDITISTDSWGGTKTATIEDLIKDKFDKTMTQLELQKRIDSQVKDEVDQKMINIKKDIDKSVESYVSDKLKDVLADNVKDIIGINKLTSNQ